SGKTLESSDHGWREGDPPCAAHGGPPQTDGARPQPARGGAPHPPLGSSRNLRDHAHHALPASTDPSSAGDGSGTWRAPFLRGGKGALRDGGKRQATPGQLKETFLVLSGDALTDLPLSAAIE